MGRALLKTENCANELVRSRQAQHNSIGIKRKLRPAVPTSSPIPNSPYKFLPTAYMRCAACRGSRARRPAAAGSARAAAPCAKRGCRVGRVLALTNTVFHGKQQQRAHQQDMRCAPHAAQTSSVPSHRRKFWVGVASLPGSCFCALVAQKSPYSEGLIMVNSCL